jgi:hypothetical protein
MLSKDWLDVDRPPLGVNATPEATERQSLRLEVQHHVVAAQRADHFPNPARDEADERDGTNGTCRDVQRPFAGVNACVKHVRSNSNKPATWSER